MDKLKRSEIKVPYKTVDVTEAKQKSEGRFNDQKSENTRLDYFQPRATGSS